MDEATPLDPALRTVSDTFLQQLDRVLALEERKRNTPVEDEGFPALATEVEDATRALLERAARQKELAAEVHAEAVAGDTTGTIEDIPADLTPTGILALWREAERELEQALPDSQRRRDLEWTAALCDAYQRAYRDQR